MFCKHCGTAMEPHHFYCSHCGNSLENSSKQHSQQKHYPFTRWLKRILIILVIGFLGIISFALLTDNITDVVKDQLQDIRENKITEAYYNFTTKDFQQSTTLEHFREYLAHSPPFSTSLSVRFIDRHVEHDKGTLKALLMTKQGKEIPVQYDLIKEGGLWKIEGIQLDEQAADSPQIPYKSRLTIPPQNITLEIQK